MSARTRHSRKAPFFVPNDGGAAAAGSVALQPFARQGGEGRRAVLIRRGGRGGGREEGGRGREEGGRRKEKGGRRKEEGGRRKEEEGRGDAFLGMRIGPGRAGS